MADYRPFEPMVRGALAQADPQLARQNYDKLMGELDGRLGQLAALTSSVGVTLDLTIGSVDAVESWLCGSIERSTDDPQKLMPVWYSVANDVGLYIGEVATRNIAGLAWQFNENRASEGFQRHVIGEKSLPGGAGWTWDVSMSVVSLAYEVIDGKRPRLPFFSKVLRDLQGHFGAA
jgi:hypothetical protein